MTYCNSFNDLDNICPSRITSFSHILLANLLRCDVTLGVIENTTLVINGNLSV